MALQWRAVTSTAPAPFTANSERFEQGYVVPKYSTEDKFSFGEGYDENILDLVLQHAEILVTDRVAYIGPEKGNIAEKMQDRFALINPVTRVESTSEHFESTPGEETRIEIEVPYLGAEFFFQEIRDRNRKPPAKSRTIFDKVIIKDSIDGVHDCEGLLKNIFPCLARDGRLLIIHRAASVNTLPVFASAARRMIDHDRPFIDILRALQNVSADVNWELENLTVQMDKIKWLALIKSRYPSDILDRVGDRELESGLRELVEGVFKYEGDRVEFVDRLLFVSATHKNVTSRVPVISRVSQRFDDAFETKFKYRLEVTSDIEKFLEEKRKREEDSVKMAPKKIR